MTGNEEPLSDEKLWSWVDRDAPELQEYLNRNPGEHERVKAVQKSIKGVIQETSIPIPERVGEYAVKGLLGEGGMGLVLEAEQESPRRPVAVKILRAHLASDPSSVARFRREAEVLGKLSHPGIARIYDAGETEQGRHFLVMELIRGKSLQEYVRDENPSRPERLRLLAEIAEAVHAAHEEGIVHRDLKPTNVLLDSRGRPTVVDFGLAGVSDVDLLLSSVTESGKLLGTPQFMSPEQIRGESDRIDRRTDVYALGVILFQLLTGELPYRLQGKPITEVARLIDEEAPLRPDSLDPSLRGDLTTIVLKALEKDREQRYATAWAMAEDVRRFLQTRPIRARRPTAIYRLRKVVVRNKLTSVLALGIVALGAVLLMPGRPLQTDLEKPLVGGGSAAERSPFTAVRWEGVSPRVEIDGRWYEPLEIDGLRVPRLVEFCRERTTPRRWWRKRFAEDLVQIVERMGRHLGESVDVKARDVQSGQTVVLEDVAATTDKRASVWRDRNRMPFTDLRWDGDRPWIDLDGRWYELLAIEGIPVPDLTRVTGMRESWRSVFARDFLELLTDALGMSPPAKVRLELRGTDSQETVSLRSVTMTHEKRRSFLRNQMRRAREARSR